MLMCIVILSCKKGNQRNANSLIIGKWNNLNIENATSLTSNPSRRIIYTFSRGEYIEFFDDGTLIDFGGDYGYYAYSPSIHNGTYSISGNKLYTTNSSQTFYDTLEIQSITDSKLTLYKAKPHRNGGTEEEWNNFLK
jgi:hypothetical protein